MEQLLVNRKYISGVFIFLILFSVFLVFPIGFGFGFSGGGDLEASVALYLLDCVIFVNIVLSLFLIFLLFRPYLSIKTFKKILIFYFILLAILSFLFFSFLQSGFLFKKIKGTETECKIISFISDARHSEYCYENFSNSDQI